MSEKTNPRPEPGVRKPAAAKRLGERASQPVYLHSTPRRPASRNPRWQTNAYRHIHYGAEFIAKFAGICPLCLGYLAPKRSRIVRLNPPAKFNALPSELIYDDQGHARVCLGGVYYARYRVTYAPAETRRFAHAECAYRLCASDVRHRGDEDVRHRHAPSFAPKDGSADPSFPYTAEPRPPSSATLWHSPPSLKNAGLSTREIAPVVNASRMTVERDTNDHPVTNVTGRSTPPPDHLIEYTGHVLTGQQERRGEAVRRSRR